MKKQLTLLILLLVFSSVFAQNCVHMLFFYSSSCRHCANADEFLQGLEEKYPDMVIDRREVHEAGNTQLFMDYLNNYGVPQDMWGYVPALFINDKAYIGADTIEQNVESGILYCSDNKCLCPFNQTLAEQYGARPFPEANTTSVVAGQNIQPSTPIELTFSAITISALIDSINPCAFAVIIFLLTYLVNLGARNKIIKIGLVYSLAVFLTYFLSGLGLFIAVQSTGMTRIIYFAATILAILAGLVNIKDYFWYGKGFTLRIPEKYKPKINKLVKKASVPAAVILGFLVALWELPCTGGVYLAILGLLSNRMTQVQAIIPLLWYNFIFVLPLLFIVFIVAWGTSVRKLEKWRMRKRKYMKLFSGLLMIVLGLAMILEWI